VSALRKGGARLGRELAASFPASDFALWSAGVTFFALLGLVPLALVSLWLAAVLVGADRLLAGLDVAIGGLPGGHGTPQALRVLAATAVQLSGWHVLVRRYFAWSGVSWRGCWASSAS